MQPAEPDFPTTPLQEFVWHELTSRGSSSDYNCVRSTRETGELDVRAFTDTLAELVERHDALRYGFVPHGPVMRQRAIHRSIVYRHHDLRRFGRSRAEQDAARLLAAFSFQALDVISDPLFQTFTATISDSEVIVAHLFHHLIIDGWSIDLLMRERNLLYRSRSESSDQRSGVVESPTQFGDHVERQRRSMPPTRLERNREYWEQQAAVAPRPTLHGSDSHRGSDARVWRRYPISSGDRLRLERLAQRQRCSEFTLFFALIAAALSEILEARQLLFAVAHHNRTPATRFSPIGWVSTVMPVSATFGDQPDLVDAVPQARAGLRTAVAHKDIDPRTFLSCLGRNDVIWVSASVPARREGGSEALLDSSTPFVLPAELYAPSPLSPEESDLNVDLDLSAPQAAVSFGYPSGSGDARWEQTVAIMQRLVSGSGSVH